MPFELRITDAGRAALADGANRGTNAIRLTKMALGSGQGPGGEADDGRAALRDQKIVVALGGSTMVSGRIAVKGEFEPAEAFDVTELGLLGQVGNGAEELYAYWTHASDVLASTLAGTRLVIAGSLDIQPAAAEVTVTVDASISLGDPALSGAVTALGGRVDTIENANYGAGLMAAMVARAALDTRIDTLEAGGFAALIAALAARVTALEGGSVIESIQRGVAMGSGAGVSVTIVSVDPAKTMVNLLSSIGAMGGVVSSEVMSCRLTSATTLEIKNSLGSLEVAYEVIEFA